MRADAERGKFCLLNFDVNDFALHADEFNFFYVVDTQQQAANFFSVFAQLLVSEAVARERVNRAENFVVSVVEERPHNSFGQIIFYVVAKISHVAPRRTNLFGQRVFVELNVNHRFAGASFTAQVVEVRDVLQFFFELVGNLLLHFVGGRARPISRDNHLAHDKFRVFHAAEVEVRKNSSDERHDDKIPNERAIVQRQFG